MQSEHDVLKFSIIEYHETLKLIFEKKLRTLCPQGKYYFGQGYKNNVAKLNGYPISLDVLRKVMQRRFGGWPQKSDVKKLMIGTEYFSKKAQCFKTLDGRMFEAYWTMLLNELKIEAISLTPEFALFNPLDCVESPSLVALIIGMYCADGSIDTYRGVATITMKYQHYADFFKSLCSAVPSILSIKKGNSDQKNDKCVLDLRSCGTSAENAVLLTAWLTKIFGKPKMKSSCFQAYPKEIHSWDDEVLLSYCLGLYIGDGSCSIANKTNVSNRVTNKVSLLCRPVRPVTGWFSQIEQLVHRTQLNNKHIKKESKSNIIGISNQGSYNLLKKWLELQSLFCLESSYKTSALEIAVGLMSISWSSISEPLQNQLLTLKLTKKPDDINSKVASILNKLVLEKGTVLLKPSKPKELIDTSHFDPTLSGGKDCSCSQIYEQILHNAYLKLGKNKFPASQRTIGKYMKTMPELAGSYINFTDQSLGEAFIEVARKMGDKRIDREWEQILSDSAPDYSWYEKFRNKEIDFTALQHQFECNEMKFENGSYIACKSNRMIKENLLKYYNAYI